MAIVTDWTLILFWAIPWESIAIFCHPFQIVFQLNGDLFLNVINFYGLYGFMDCETNYLDFESVDFVGKSVFRHLIYG